MFTPVNTKDPTAVEVEVQAAYLAMFPNGDPMFIPRVFGWTIECFTGNHANYQAVDAKYHDLEHTMQGTLCMARLLHGRFLSGTHPPITQRMFQLGLLAILLHDTGYLKQRGDHEGTGAKFTAVHVERSAEFAAHLLAEKGFSAADIQSVQNMIHCTGVDAALSVIPFGSEMEKVVGHALGTADLLGQMAAQDYVEKLPVLFSEFAEAAHHLKERTHFISLFSSAHDLMQKTPVFWEKYVLPKLTKDFGGLYRFLNRPFPEGPNDYLNRIEANMDRLREKLAATTAS
ncbi:MAG: hypothetical protein EPO07_00760 [Verrucomicrobia bacterium]|nr:MAG: hypothetical protein EPO07_00760 [Verrucomicrobiota bacterium]